MRLLPFLLLASCLPCPCPARGALAVDWDRIVASDGTVLSCESHGEPVQIAWDATLPRLAWSSPGMIRLRPDLAKRHASLQKFAFLHECGHLQAPMTERAADCWAAGRVEELRAMRLGDWEALHEEMAPEGEARWHGIQVCRGEM